ncbi:MAG: glycosyltransferase family 4 protein [Conexivisphaera sp.]
MRIAFLSIEYPPVVFGGLGTYAGEVARRVAAAGHEVHVFSWGKGERVDGNVKVHGVEPMDFTRALAIVANDELRRWGPGFRYLNDVLVYNAAAALGARNWDFDLIHAHDWLSAPAGMALADSLGLPLILHLHSTERGRNLGGGSGTVAALELEAARRADAVVTVSNAMRDCDLAPQGFPLEKVRVIWNGVDPDVYDPSRVDRREVERLREVHGARGGILILFLGRLVREKGVEELVEAMPRVRREHPGARLVMVGQGNLRDSLLRRVRELGLEGSVFLVDRFLELGEKLAYYAAADLAVFPSIYEPFGIVALEAMSMGKPVVVGASGCSGLREIVVPSGPDKCGIHVDGRDPGDIAWGILAALADADEMRRMGENGRRRVLENFTWDVTVRRTLDLYSEVAGRS